MTRAVHRLQGQHLLVAALGDEHVLAEFFPMTGGFPQAAIEQLRALDLEIAGGIEPHAQVVLDAAKERPALRMPEDAADRLFAHMEEVELAPEPAMITALCLFELEEVLVELLLACPGRAINPLQLRVFRIAAPVCARHVGQLEGLAETAGRGQMRPNTQIDKIALPVEADLLSLRDLADILGLVALATVAKKGDSRVAVPDLTGDLLVAAHDVVHPRLDLAEIFGRERLGAGEIVIKPGFRRRPERDLGVGIELLDRLGHDMGSVMPQDLEPFGGVSGDDRDGGILVDHRSQVARPAIDPDRDRRLGEPRPNCSRNFAARDRAGKFEAFAVRQGRHDRRRTAFYGNVKDVFFTHLRYIAIAVFPAKVRTDV